MYSALSIFILATKYRLVKEKLYCQVVRMLWKDAHCNTRTALPPRDLELFAKEAFQEALSADEFRFCRNSFTTDAVLLGVGAPIHIFLPDVAKALHTSWRVSDYSPVSNALGAVLGNVCVYETVHISADPLSLEADEGEGTFVVYGEKREAFEALEDAIARAAVIAERSAARRAFSCGAKKLLSVSHEVKRRSSATYIGEIKLGAEVTACARGELL